MALFKSNLLWSSKQGFAATVRFCSSNSSINDTLLKKNIGMIGLGRVGGTIYKNLERNGFKVVAIHDYDLQKCKGYPDSVKVRSTPREVAQDSNIIVSALPSASSVKSAFKGSDGILAGILPGAIWIDHSITDYEQNKRFGQMVEAKGANMLESPITGSLDELKQCKMRAWVAGKEAVLEEVKPLLSVSCSTVRYSGELGSALIPKIISNMFNCVQIIAMTELLMLAKKSNIDLETLWYSIRSSSGNSFAWETAAPHIFKGDFVGKTSLEVQSREIQLLIDMAKSLEVPTQFMEQVQKTYLKTMKKYGPEGGPVSPSKLVEEETGESLRTPGFEKWNYDVEFVDGALRVKHLGLKPKGKQT